MDVLQFSRMCWNHLDVGSNPFLCSWLFEIWCNMAFHIASLSQLFRLKLGGNKSTIRIPVLGCFENLSLKIDMATQKRRFERCYFPYSIGWNISVPAINFGGKKSKLPSPPCVHEGFTTANITILTLQASASPALVEQVKRRCGEEQLRQAIALPWPKVQNGIPQS